jgi:hypothetical protein
VAQGVGPEFKPQDHQKKKKEKDFKANLTSSQITLEKTGMGRK